MFWLLVYNQVTTDGVFSAGNSPPRKSAHRQKGPSLRTASPYQLSPKDQGNTEDRVDIQGKGLRWLQSPPPLFCSDHGNEEAETPGAPPPQPRGFTFRKSMGSRWTTWAPLRLCPYQLGALGWETYPPFCIWKTQLREEPTSQAHCEIKWKKNWIVECLH